VLDPSAQRTLRVHVIVDGNSAAMMIGGGKRSPSSGIASSTAFSRLRSGTSTRW